MKHKIKHTCGHDELHDIYGPKGDALASKIKRLAAHKCARCIQKIWDRGDDATNEYINAVNA